METIKIGRRELDKEVFVKAVAENNSLTTIIKAIGWNPIPTSTRESVASTIEEMGLDISHIKQLKKQGNYVTREKQFTLSTDNQIYLNSFLNSLSEKSAPSYKASCGNFLEEIGEQDFMTVTKEQMLEFANRRKSDTMKKNVEAHLRSMLIYLVENDINNAVSKVDKQMLIWLIRK